MFKNKKVTKNGITMNVLVPVVEDKIEQRDLDQMAEGSDVGFKRQPKPESKMSSSDRKELLREMRDYKNRKGEINTKKYY